MSRPGAVASLLAGAAIASVCGAVPVRAATQLIPGSIGLVKAGLAKGVFKGTFTLPALPDDDPTIEGGALFVTDTNGGTGSVFNLPASGWSGLGNPAGSKGLKYKGAGSPTDPCRIVLVKTNVIKFLCKGSGVTVTPPINGNLGVQLVVGSGSENYCASFPVATATKNDGKLFKAKDSVAPAVCSGGNTCSPVTGSRKVAVAITTPAPLAGISVDLTYPPFQTTIPGSGNSGLVTSKVNVLQTQGLNIVNDLDTSVAVTLANATAVYNSGPLFEVNFDQCVALAQNVCNRNLDVIGCCNNPADPNQFVLGTCDGNPGVTCDDSLDCVLASAGTKCDGLKCYGNPPVCPVGRFPTSSVGPCEGKVCSNESGRICAADGDCRRLCTGQSPTKACTSDADCNTGITCGAQGTCTKDVPSGACPAENACKTQTEITGCTITDPVDAQGQPVGGVTCAVTITP